MNQQDIHNALRQPLVNNIGNKLTPELLAGLLASMSDALMKLQTDQQEQQDG